MEAVFDSLGRLDGVHDVSIDLQRNLVTVVPARDRTLDLAAIPRAIRSAGFRPGALRLRGRGAIESSTEGPRVRLAGWPVSFAWTGAELPPSGAAFTAGVVESASDLVLSPAAAPDPSAR